MNLNVSAVPSTGGWSSELNSGRLALSNTETNLGKLTVGFNLSVSQSHAVKLRVYSYNAAGQVTGTLEGEVVPPVVDAFQRYSVDLSTMKAVSGTFDPPAYSVRPAAGGGSNSANGLTEATAFATPAKAVSVARAGDIIDVMGGTYTIAYTGTNAIDFSVPGTPSAWITLKNYPGQSPEIDNAYWSAINVGNGTNGTHATTAAVAYIEVSGLHVRGNADTINKTNPELLGATDPRTNNNGISVDGRYELNHPHDIRFADNFVEYCSGAGIGAGETDRIQIENNVVQNTSWWTKYATSGIDREVLRRQRHYHRLQPQYDGLPRRRRGQPHDGDQ